MSEYEKMIENINPTIQDVIKDIDHCKLGIFPTGVVTENYETFLSSYQVKKVLEYLANPKLNKNQQVVLDYGKTIDIYDFMEELSCNHYRTPDSVTNAINNLDKKQLAQVLQVFSAWVIEQEGE